MTEDREWAERKARELDAAVSRGWTIPDWITSQQLKAQQVASVMDAFQRLQERKRKEDETGRKSPGAYD